MATEKYTFIGWDLKELLRHNKDNLKALVVFLSGYTYLVGFDWRVFLIGLGAIAGKMVLDTIDYWLKE